MNERRHVIVSGGSRGLGEALVEELLRTNYVVSCFSRKASPFIERTLTTHGDRFHFLAADAADSGSLKAFVGSAAGRFGAPWGLVNNAAIVADQLHALASEDSIRRLVDVNLVGALLLSKLCIRAMLPSRRGRIVNISSIVGLRGYRGLVTYGATKAALDGMTRALARELGEAAITVNSVAPGYLETEMSSTLDPEQRKRIVARTPLGRLGTVADVVPVIGFLLSDDSAFMTGQTLVVDGGITI